MVTEAGLQAANRLHKQIEDLDESIKHMEQTLENIAIEYNDRYNIQDISDTCKNRIREIVLSDLTEQLSVCKKELEKI